MKTTMRCAAWMMVAMILAGTGCQHKSKPDFTGELPPGQVALRKIPPEMYPDFSHATWNLNLLGRSADHSIAYLQHPSAKRSFPYLDISHERALATCIAFKELVGQAYGKPDAGPFIDQQIRANFEVYKSVGAPNPDGGFTDIVLFTGYCTPIYEASLTKQGPFVWPLYKRPQGLVTDPMTGETAQPWKTRQEIESGAMAGQEFVWLKSRWEAYMITVQGSARLKLQDGRLYEVGFAGVNGHEYTSPSDAMIRDGLLTRSERNAKTLGRIFEQHPELMDKYLWMNKRTVFFTERPGGPFGALNVPVTTSATIATDKTVDSVSGMTVYPRAMPAFLDVEMPLMEQPDQTWQFRGFMMDQDTGGAIRAAGRSDIYMGIGEGAERMAGRQMYEGALYYVAVKPALVQQYLQKAPPVMPGPKKQ